MKISIDSSGIDKMISSLANLSEKNIAFAASLALNRTGQIVRNKITDSIPSTFKNPNAYTRNSIMLRPSTKTDLTAEIRFKDHSAAKHYLEAQVYGGQRGLKRSEELLRGSGNMPSDMVWIPGIGARRDGNGMSRGQMMQILSGLQAQFDPLTNSTARSRKRKKRRNEYYFSITNRASHLPPGVYHNVAGRTIPLLRYVAMPSYKAIWDYWGIADKARLENFESEMQRAILYVFSTRY
jgi:hypothetical protein